MKKPWINVPSLGSIHAKGYWVTLLVLMFGGVLIFLHYILLVTIAVPIVGALHREPKLIWRASAVVTMLSAAGYLMFRFTRDGSSGLVFFYGADSFGFTFPQINALSFLIVALIFLPLSGACAIDRIREYRKRAESGPRD